MRSIHLEPHQAQEIDLTSSPEDDDDFLDCRCPRCGQNLYYGETCPHTLLFDDYFEVSFNVEDLRLGEPSWVQISAWLNYLVDKLEEAKGLDWPEESESDAVISTAMDLPEHLRPIVVDHLRNQDHQALSNYVWSRIHSLPGFISVVSFEPMSAPGMSLDVKIPMVEDPKTAMRELDAQLLPDIEALKQAVQRLEALVNEREGQ